MYTIPVSKEEITHKLTYADGELYWNNNSSPNVRGKRAGVVKAKGYRYICLNGIQYREHRLIYIIHHGYAPQCIDHIDGNKLNNRIENLQGVSNSTNLLKSPVRKDSSSGIKGVCRRGTKWKACVNSIHGSKQLGVYNSIEEASSVLKKFYSECLCDNCRQGRHQKF